MISHETELGEWGKYRERPWCKYTLRARDRQIKDLWRAKNDPEFPYYFSEKEADRAANFFPEYLRHSEGQRWFGKPFYLADWQEWDVIRPLFGWLRKDNDRRRFRKSLLFVPKKSGKSPIASGIGLYGLTADCEPAAQIFTAATKEDQARIILDYMKNMIDQSPILDDILTVHVKRIWFRMLRSFIAVLGSDSKKNDGFQVHMGLVDELHAHPDRSVLEILARGTIAREQPLILMTSTAGFDPGSPLLEEVDYAKRILDETLENDQYHIFIAEVDDPEKWDEDEEILKANVNAGISIATDVLFKDRDEARDRASIRNDFRVKHCNIFTTSGITWIELPQIRASDCKPIDWLEFEGEPCYGSFDKGASRDLSSFVLAFRGPGVRVHSEDGGLLLPSVFLRCLFWLPEDIDIDQKARDDKAPYREWIADDWIRTTPGRTSRNDIIEQQIWEECQRFDVRKITADRWGATDILQNLEDRGLEVQDMPQTTGKLDFGITEFEKAVVDKRLFANQNPVLHWNVAGAVLFMDTNGRCKIMKNKGNHRVDGAVAACMAVGELLKAPARKRSKYEDADPVVV